MLQLICMSLRERKMSYWYVYVHILFFLEDAEKRDSTGEAQVSIIFKMQTLLANEHFDKLRLYKVLKELYSLYFLDKACMHSLYLNNYLASKK